jgi:hypothetical protein
MGWRRTKERLGEAANEHMMRLEQSPERVVSISKTRWPSTQLVKTSESRINSLGG